jgi:hypothetical protein
MHDTRLRNADADAWPDVPAAIASGGWTADAAPTQRLRRTFLDTFDGRLLRRGQVVELEHRRDAPDRLRCTERAGDRSLAEAALPVAESGPAEAARPLFAWDLPAGGLADALGPVLDERALLPFASISTGRGMIGVRDGEAKLIARVVVDDDTLVEAEGVRRRTRLGRTLRIEPVRGYER